MEILDSNVPFPSTLLDRDHEYWKYDKEDWGVVRPEDVRAWDVMGMGARAKVAEGWEGGVGDEGGGRGRGVGATVVFDGGRAK